MEDSESQVAKIQIGNFRHTSSFVHLLAERAGGSEAELYVVAELPLLNPAALEPCEHICLAIAGTLKRAYRKAPTSATFETAIAEINDELAKLAGMGQTSWVNRLNCIVAVKEGSNFNISTTGKVFAYLFRSGEFTDISCSPEKSHVIKTFENLAAGRLKLGDTLLLSTPQLFNYLSRDRLRSILSSDNFLNAAQTIIEILKENAGPEVAFGTLLNLLVPKGQAVAEEIDLEEYETRDAGLASVGIIGRLKNFLASFALAEKIRRRPRTGLPKVSLTAKLPELGGSAQKLAARGKDAWNALAKGASAGKTALSSFSIKNASTQRKFFLASLAILLIAAVFSITVSLRMRKTRQAEAEMQKTFSQISELIGKADASFLYKDTGGAKKYLAEAAAKLPKAEDVSEKLRTKRNELAAALENDRKKMEMVREPQVTNLGSLASGDRLIKLPGILAVQTGNLIISYNKSSGLIQDGSLKIDKTVKQSVFAGGNLSVVYDGEKMYVWDSTKTAVGAGINSSVPEDGSLGGLAYYSTNSRVYAVNKKTGQVVSFVVGPNSLSKPVSWGQSVDFTTAQDITIDGSIYVLNSTGVSKYTSGRLAEFNQPQLLEPFSGTGKIYTEKDYKNIYVMDSGHRRVIVMDKKGNLVSTLVSKEFQDLKDMAVDEKNSQLYLLAGSSLLRVNF